MNVRSLWSTAEGESWARSFDYETYVYTSRQMGNKASLLSRQGYAEFCQFMHREMERSWNSMES